MTESVPPTERILRTFRGQLEAIRRRRAARRETHEFAMRRLEAKLVSREAEGDDD